MPEGSVYVGGVIDRKAWALQYSRCVQEPRRCVLLYKINKTHIKCTSAAAMKQTAQ